MARRTQSARDQPSEAVQEDAAALLVVLQKRFAERFREARLELGLTQADVSDRTGVNQLYVGRIEHGRKNLTLDTMIRLSLVVGRDVSEMLSEAEDSQDG